jgi:hypothetical protein
MLSNELREKYLNIAADLFGDEADQQEMMEEARQRLAALRANDPMENYYAQLLLDLWHDDLLGEV